jgi:hypothetical protein
VDVAAREIEFQAGGGGGQSQPTSVALSILLLVKFEVPGGLCGSNVLELGSGVGLPGLAISHPLLRAAGVVLTDFYNLRFNAETNFNELFMQSLIEVIFEERRLICTTVDKLNNNPASAAPGLPLSQYYNISHPTRTQQLHLMPTTPKTNQ